MIQVDICFKKELTEADMECDYIRLLFVFQISYKRPR